MRTWLAAVIAFLLARGAWPAPAPAPAAPAGLSLTEAVRYAVSHSPTLNTAEHQAAIADLQYRNSVASFLPSLDLSAQDGWSRTKVADTPIGGNPWTSDLNLALTETLYDNGQSITKYRIARLGADVARINFEGSRAQLCLDVSNAYYKYSLARALAEVAQSRQKILGHQFTAVSADYRQGMKTRQDYLRFKTQVQRADIDLLSAESDARAAEAALRRALATPLSGAEPVAFAVLEARPIEAEREVPRAAPPLEGVYSYRSSELSRQINELNETFSRRLYWPQLSVTAGATYDNNGYLGRDYPPFAASNTLSWNAQLQLTYNIWDWGTRARNVEIAEHTRAVNDNSLTSSNLSLRENIETLMLQLGTLRESYKLSLELLQLSQQSYDYLEEQYRLGRISYLDIINGLNDLLDAKSKFLNSHFTLLQSLAQYRYYEGTLYETVSKP